MHALLLMVVAASNPVMVSSSDVTNLDGTWEARLSDEGGLDESGTWRPVRVPGNFPFQGIDYDGIAWLRLRFSVSSATEDYAVRMPPAANAYEFFVNGASLGGRGRIGPSGELVEKNLRGQVYRVPKELLRVGAPNTLTIRLRTFYGNGGVIAPGTLAGPERLVRDEAEARVIKVSMLVALFFFAAFFHLLLYLARTRERHYLSFTLLASALAIITAGINMLGYVLTTNSDFNAYLVFVPLILLPSFFTTFFADFYGRVATWRKRVTNGFAGVALLTLVSSTLYHPLFPFFERVILPLTVLILGGTLVMCVWWTVQALVRKQRGARAIVIGLVVYAATGLMELSWTFSLIPFRVDSHLGFAVFIGAMVVAISERFAWLHRQVELGEKDALTGCLTRHGFLERLTTLLAADGPLTCIVFDLDHFKRINDSLGHLAGDRVLAAAGYVVRGALRSEDVVVRWGGEEFLVVLPGQTEAQALEVAERLKNALSQQETEGVSFTASFGVALRLERESFEGWVSRADHAMYEAKQAGRNCIRAAPSSTPGALVQPA